MGTVSVLIKTPCPTQKGCKQGYLFFYRKGLEPRVLPWQQYSKSHFVAGAKFEDHCSNISGDTCILIQYFIVLVELSMTSSFA